MTGGVLETGLSHAVDQLILKLISTPFSGSVTVKRVGFSVAEGSGSNWEKVDDN